MQCGPPVREVAPHLLPAWRNSGGSIAVELGREMRAGHQMMRRCLPPAVSNAWSILRILWTQGETLFALSFAVGRPTTQGGCSRHDELKFLLERGLGSWRISSAFSCFFWIDRRILVLCCFCCFVFGAVAVLVWLSFSCLSSCRNT